ncbi:copper amine oxidase N-terminal domain-containing protein [Cohnella nanjingensis]|uniref:Copper amine oxidase N-terminal domain-containing protein n=1 Tax=Cohnella nanjingensis TaxID=1387779 RepID=A0A7X0VDE0_9BACL|nr:copper amine oxidase N-terminal domain-containing protein [Cohnella nanjingensis]MBB6669596.1 copper amine oxidase N-terminal domain-containing protein [Cohnella nanjingensis]
MHAIRVKWRALGLSVCLAVGSLAGAGLSSAATAAAKPIVLEINGNTIASAQHPYLEKDSVYVPLRTVSTLLQAVVDWNAKTKQVSIYAPGHTVKLTLGQKTVQHNGQALPMTTPAQLKDGSVYVPIRFIAQTLGATVDWQSAKRTVSIADDGKLVMGWATTEAPAAFWLNIRTGELYESYPFASPAKLTGKLDTEFKGLNVSLRAERLKEGEFVVTASNFFGEPQVNMTATTSYIKDDKLLRQAEASYFQRMTNNVAHFRWQPLLTDGKSLFLLNPDGSEATTYDLPKLGAKDESYSVEGIGDGYLLIRPNLTGLLTLVDPVNGNQKLLYELLDQPEREYAEKNDIPYRGDTLVVTGEQEGIIYLEYQGVKDKAVHKLQVKVKDWL